MRDLVWSPLEPKLLAWGKDNAVWQIDVETNKVEQVIGGKWNAEPSWSPDGSMIVVSSDVVPPDAQLSDDIQIIPAEIGSQEEDRINLTYSGAFVEDVNPHFSPDGEHIAYTTRNMMDDRTDPFYESPYGLLMIDADCIKKTSTCLDSRQLLSKKGQDITRFAWSPDSQYIAYIVSDDPMNLDNSYGDLWLVDVTTGKTRQVTSSKTTGTFSWAPDSSAVVFERVTDSSYDVYLAFVNDKRDPGPVLTGFRASATPYWAHP
jgi:Tol biopolymer transport system component